MTKAEAVIVSPETASTDAATQSRRSSFYAAMRILPAPQREAMFQIYAFCRAVDDIADEEGPLPERAQALLDWRADIDALYRGAIPRAALVPLSETIHAFGLAREDFVAVIDGMEMDLTDRVAIPDFATLDLYCDRVASAVGRLSVRVFGVPETEGQNLAYHLGRAFQLTNILRDIDEDAERQRLYLPRDLLIAAGIKPEIEAVLTSPALGQACRSILDAAAKHFAAGAAIMDRCPRKSVRAPRIMAQAYGAILTRLEARGFAPPRERVKTPKSQILLALLRYGFF
ncbi:presqualene diphosphate synthase HpnD [Beijerinckia indica]|uniref:Squalene synthase HpnD n=1 Tax=Beijerinckia indica subsp. indica (strain ATCC 9039 / DSM 1715 / NCIMB 8712) TaxID=395963 RepID=B2ICB8_BEII9|nr:presqualene diphosphate synthase HpnD [Beijerinckia indica]ACB96715.1 squalene synthase HpnD [Beijerinckia indica subsp. indica ATCC 9039]